MTANDSKLSDCGGVARRVPNGGTNERATNVADAPLAESTRRDTPEQFAAAPLLAVISFRRERCISSENLSELALDAWSDAVLKL